MSEVAFEHIEISELFRRLSPSWFTGFGCPPAWAWKAVSIRIGNGSGDGLTEDVCLVTLSANSFVSNASQGVELGIPNRCSSNARFQLGQRTDIGAWRTVPVAS